MKLFVWCLTVLTSFSLGMLVMFVFNYPYENYGNETKEIKVANVSSSSTSADEIEEPEKFNVSLKEALETYQTCYPNQAITSVKVSQTGGPYYYEITGRDATKECSVRISTKTANIKKKVYRIRNKHEQATTEQSADLFNIKNLKSLSEVTEVAEETTGTGKAVMWYLERQSGKSYWTITIKEKIKKVTVKVDAYTGEVLKAEQK
ncbi:PepSY domain-containing protein [Enterococcus hirae]|nr:PepSY domain-containing protein [Enterococcus hirae]